ncbi:MAG: rRNA maturation RNase YbeY [Candidatus Omnitrophica bacterium]|nr:rRNA maturation RNase YbeY [Candidatus Omnitrophota bacterium]
MPRPRFEITVQNKQRRVRLSKVKLIQLTQKVLEILGWKRIGLSLVLVNDSEIQKLHHEYMGENTPTDVMAFGQMEGKPFPQGKTPFLGDVVVSVETARRRGPQFGNKWDEELLLYICHGILHLMGYRDSTPGKKALMEKKQKQVVKKVLGTRWRFKRPKRLF